MSVGFCLSVFFLQVKDRLTVAVQTLAFDGLFAVHASVRDLPEGFSCIYVGDMHLNSRDGNRLQCIQNGDGGVGVGSRINDDSVDLAVGFLNLIYDSTFVI